MKWFSIEMMVSGRDFRCFQWKIKDAKREKFRNLGKISFFIAQINILYSFFDVYSMIFRITEPRNMKTRGHHIQNKQQYRMFLS